LKKKVKTFSLEISIYPIIKISCKVNNGNWPGRLNTADVRVLSRKVARGR